MKIFTIATVSAFSSERSSREASERRYTQLTSMIRFYNRDFDETKYSNYGCHCDFLGQFLISYICIWLTTLKIGGITAKGVSSIIMVRQLTILIRPVKRTKLVSAVLLKSTVKRATHTEDTGMVIKTVKLYVVTMSAPVSMIFACVILSLPRKGYLFNLSIRLIWVQNDYPLDKKHAVLSDSFNNDYYHLWSQSEFEPGQNCRPHGQNQFPADMKCCQAENMRSPFVWYNANLVKCCANGSTRSLGEIC